MLNNVLYSLGITQTSIHILHKRIVDVAKKNPHPHPRRNLFMKRNHRGNRKPCIRKCAACARAGTLARAQDLCTARHSVSSIKRSARVWRAPYDEGSLSHIRIHPERERERERDGGHNTRGAKEGNNYTRPSAR